MKKLKDILLEGYAWERKEGKPLPTLAEVQAEYQRNEAANDAKAKVAKLEKDLANLKHQYYSDKNLTDEKSQRLKQQMGDIGRKLKGAKREYKTGSAGYNPNPERKSPTSPSSKPQPRWQDNDGDGNWYEPGVDVKENVNEGASFQERFADYSNDALGDMIVTLRRFDGTKDDIRELEQELARRKQDKDNVNEYGDDETHSLHVPETDVEPYDEVYKESILRKNLRRFGVKNLAENAFQGEPVEDDGDTVTVYQNKYDMVNLKVNGQMRQLLWLPMKKNLQQALDLAREDDAYLPTKEELDSLQKLIRPGETVGNIWVDQGNDAPANMRHVLFNLSDGADVVSNNTAPQNTVSDAVVLLRKTPMTGAVRVSPKP